MVEHKTELKPCPFCGGKVTYGVAWCGPAGRATAGCQRCKIFAHATAVAPETPGGSARDAIAAWNRRAESPELVALRADLVREREARERADRILEAAEDLADAAEDLLWDAVSDNEFEFNPSSYHVGSEELDRLGAALVAYGKAAGVETDDLAPASGPAPPEPADRPGEGGCASC